MTEGAEASVPDRVVVLHGIGQSAWNMSAVTWWLRRAGFEARAFSYASTRYGLDALAGRLQRQLAEAGIWETEGKVHFVTHSMGGLLAARYLADYRGQFPENRLGRVVMLAPPLGGSEVADLLGDTAPYRWYYGPAGQELRTPARRKLPEPYYELGIIAGTGGWLYPVADRIVGGPHDGRVSVAATRVPGMKAHLTLATTHTLIPWSPAVLKQVVAFLKSADFVT